MKEKKANGESDTSLKNCLIICNGEFSRGLLNKFLRIKSPVKKFTVISCDGASNTLKKYSAAPHFIIGDLDSISPQVLAFYKIKNVSIKKVINQNKTDLEKSIDFALKMKLKNIFVIGYGGKRIDHTINNFSILKKFSGKCNIRFIDDEFEIFYSAKETQFRYKKEEVISIMGVPKAGKVKTQGLKWNLKNASLEFGKLQSALNLSISDSVKIKAGKGSLLIFKKHFGKIKNLRIEEHQ